MAKLYPPYIEGTIPAFTGTTIVVPFSMNRAVSLSQVGGYSLKIKNINGIIIETVLLANLNSESYFIEDNSITISSLSGTYSVGQYYKIQLAFIDTSGTIGYYSTVGIAKYTKEPTIKISNGIDELSFSEINNLQNKYTGIYINDDITEGLYSSEMIIYDTDSNIIYDSGEKIHYTTTDATGEITENFKISVILEDNQFYDLVYKCTTLNGLECQSSKYRIRAPLLASHTLDFSFLSVSNDNDNGFIKVYIDDSSSYLTGHFVISRKSSINENVWEEIEEFNCFYQSVKTWAYYDYTVEQGVKYQYSLQQISSSGIYSVRILSSEIAADFEDMFLYDGEKQLCIKFNPKISSFKTTILEQKTEAIGSQYPFITRNGAVNYREFPISGLISYQIDDNELFLTKDELQLDLIGSDNHRHLTAANDENEYILSADLTGKNILAERIFKLKVLDWLNNGNIKLFKSPVEGNYLVRLVNSSLSPTDTLGRMLHTFSCTAYEIMENNFENLLNEGFLSHSLYGGNDTTSVDIGNATYEYENMSTEEIKTPVWKTIRYMDLKNDDTFGASGGEYFQIVFRDFLPGTIITVDENDFVIGKEGKMSFQNLDNLYSSFSAKGQLTYGAFDLTGWDIASITYGYFTTDITSDFDSIISIKSEDHPCESYIGYGKDSKGGLKISNRIDNIKFDLASLIYARAYRRDIEMIYINGVNTDLNSLLTIEANIYLDSDCSEKHKCTITNLSMLPIYKIIDISSNTSLYFTIHQEGESKIITSYTDEDKIPFKICGCISEENSYISIPKNTIYNLTSNELKIINSCFQKEGDLYILDGIIFEIGYISNKLTFSLEDKMSDEFPQSDTLHLIQEDKDNPCNDGGEYLYSTKIISYWEKYEAYLNEYQTMLEESNKEKGITQES